MIDFAISNIAWDLKDDLTVLNFLSNNDIRNIEFVLPKVLFQYKDSVTYKAYLKRHNFTVVAAQSLFYGSNLNCFVDKKGFIDYLINLINDDIFDIPYFVLGSPKNRCSFSSEYNDFISIMKSVCGQLKTGKKLLIEPVARYYNCNLINTVEEGVKLVEKVNNLHFGLHADLGNMQLEKENIWSVFERYGAVIEHCHLSDKDLQPPSNFDILKDLKYNGIVSIEMRETELSNIISIIDRIKTWKSHI